MRLVRPILDKMKEMDLECDMLVDPDGEETYFHDAEYTEERVRLRTGQLMIGQPVFKVHLANEQLMGFINRGWDEPVRWDYKKLWWQVID